jgi:hypothetical protein
VSWTEAINSMKQCRISGAEPVAESLFVRAEAWLESRQQTNPEPSPSSVFHDNEGGLIIDFRTAERDLKFAAEFHADGTAELQTWDRGKLVDEEPIK